MTPNEVKPLIMHHFVVYPTGTNAGSDGKNLRRCDFKACFKVLHLGSFSALDRVPTPLPVHVPGCYTLRGEPALAKLFK